jgi:opacity protein-like surface antigen
VRRIILALIVVFLVASAVAALAQETQPTSLASVPAAKRSEADCTGFIAGSPVSTDLFVLGGEDDDFRSVVRGYHDGGSVFLASRGKQEFAIGSEYSVIRSAKDIFLTSQYSGQTRDINRLGRPFEDIGRVRVTHVSPEGTVAEVSFACGPINPGDILVPYQPRPIPEYTLKPRLDRFAPTDDRKAHGFVAAALNNYGVVGKRNIVYLSLGNDGGVKPGQRFRIYKYIRVSGGKILPPETVGEAVVLSVQERSSVAIVVDSFRDISAGDSIEAE